MPLARDGALAGGITLHVERIRHSRNPTGVFLALAGGPGQSATPLMEGFNRLFFSGLHGRDLVVYDQRGTGRSGLLRCPALERTHSLRPTAEAAACARRLGARRAFYRTDDSVEDIEALRVALGVERLSIYGVSYGTKVALAYAARYPSRVDRLILDSVLGLEGPDPLYLDSFGSVERILHELCPAGRCRGITRDPVADIGELVGRLREEPMSGVAYDGHGRRREIAIRPLALFDVLFVGDFLPTMRIELPAAVRSALDGDPAVIASMFQRFKPSASELEGIPPELFSTALYVTTVCEEADLPWDRSASTAERRAQARAAAAMLPDSAFAPFDRRVALGSDTLALCEEWPAGPSRPAPAYGPLPDVPVLLINGTADLRTPLVGARRVAREFPRARLVTAPVGHSVLGNIPCAGRAYGSFMAGKRVSGCARPKYYLAPRPLPPRSLRELRPRPGIGGVLRGRTMRAVELTLREAGDRFVESLDEVLFGFGDDETPVVRWGGLRGGSLRFSTSDRVKGYSFVPGVRLTGRLQLGTGEGNEEEPLVGGRFRVHGSAAASGFLRISPRDGRVTGRLGGRPVHTRLRVPLLEFPKLLAIPAQVALRGLRAGG